jgi:hypothetical protein
MACAALRLAGCEGHGDGVHPQERLARQILARSHQNTSRRRRVPAVDQHDLLRVGEDIKETGLRLPVAIWRKTGDEPWLLLDGRNRLDCMEAVGVEINFSDPETFVKLPSDTDPEQYVESINVHRRHLDQKWKQDYLAGLVRKHQGKSARAIAAEAAKDGIKVGKDKVNETIKQLESTGGIPPVEKRTGKDGKARKAPKKPKSTGIVAIDCSSNGPPIEAGIATAPVEEEEPEPKRAPISQPRPERWEGAIDRALKALRELAELQSKYQEWGDSLSEEDHHAVYENLNAIGGLDIADAIEIIEVADMIDLPQGFGRD